MKPGTIVHTVGPDGDGVVIGEPNANGLRKVAFRDGRVRMVRPDRMTERADQTADPEFARVAAHLRARGDQK